MDRKIELQQIINNSRDELKRIIESERKEDSKQYIGKYFGFSSDDGNRWFAYVRVIGINETGRFKIVKLEKDYEGFYNVNFDNDSLYRFDDNDTWQEITQMEFEDKLNMSIDKIRELFVIENEN
jgi:hypothetical protein